jgi:Putative zinc-finger
MTCAFTMSDAAYVLGSLSPADRREFESHLDGCEECSLAVRDLAGLPGLLGRVDPEVFEQNPVEPVPDTLRPRVMAAVRRRQHRRTWLTAGVAAAAAAAVTIGGAILIDRPDTAPVVQPPPSVVVPAGKPMTQVSTDPMMATVALTSVAWGTKLDLACIYPLVRGEYEGGSYALVVHTTDGHHQRVATWRGLPGKAMQLTAATASKASDISSVDVTRLNGSPVLRLAL